MFDATASEQSGHSEVNAIFSLYRKESPIITLATPLLIWCEKKKKDIQSAEST